MEAGISLFSKMSGKGTSNNGQGNSAPEPKIISGWEHSYAHRNPDRYAYIGKEDGEPQWVDWGKGSQKK
jgi:hypothetical protein